MRRVLFFVLLLSSGLGFAKDTEVAIFAGGCFWCMEPPFDKLDGVKSTTSGYIGGAASSAQYKKVSAGGTGHVEAIKIEYDPSRVNFETLLKVFWRNVDPFDDKGQFCDKGEQYKSYVYYLDEDQKAKAELSLQQTQKKFSQKFATKVIKANTFYPAEKYHQDYYQRNPIRYKFYRNGCGRDKRLKAIWGESK